MSEVFEKREIETKILTDVICDKCNKKVSVDDVFEYQEMVRLKDVGGYASKIGDGCIWSLDLCQSCFLELTGKFIQIK